MCFFSPTTGWADELAGVLSAMVARRARESAVLDLTHGVRAFDVRAGALALVRAGPPPGARSRVGVVDPGVAGHFDERWHWRSRSDDGPRHLVGPDNGLLVWASDALGGVKRSGRAAAPPGGRRSTFDGRDVFAPAAAALWQGVPIGGLGAGIDAASLVAASPSRLSVAVDGRDGGALGRRVRQCPALGARIRRRRSGSRRPDLVVVAGTRRLDCAG